VKIYFSDLNYVLECDFHTLKYKLELLGYQQRKAEVFNKKLTKTKVVISRLRSIFRTGTSVRLRERKKVYLWCMSWYRTLSGKFVILLTLVFALSTYEKINLVNSGEKPCVSAFDGFGYYMYLPHFFQYGNLNIDREWAQDLQDEYCWGHHVYQLEKRELKAEIDIYHMGLSIAMLPSYTVAEIWARAGGYETNGFSYPYHVMYLLNALLFIFLGLLYLRKLLRLFADEWSTIVTMIVIALGANTYFIFNFQYDLPHLYLFTINAAAFYHILRYFREDHFNSLIFAALLFGLAVCIRPTQMIFGIIPFLLLLKKHGKSLVFIKHLSLFAVAVVLCNIPQFLYWKLVGGQWLILNLHTEDIVLSDPNLIDFLISYRKGWLLYSPLFLILPLGWWFMFKKERTLFWATVSFSVVYIYVMSAWECWWYANSFGQRVMVDIYPILAIPIAFLVMSLRRKFAIVVASLFGLSCIALNLFQSEQTNLGILDGSRMTKEHYWHIFGKLDPAEIHNRFLLIDRGNLFWPEELSQYDDLPFILKQQNIFRLKNPVVSEPGNSVPIDKIQILKSVPTDETRIMVPLIYRTSDSTQRASLQIECFSEYNCYNWNSYELSLGRRQNQDVYDTMYFNLPEIRHDADSLQMYVYNQGGARIELMQFKIVGTSLIRD